MENRLESLELQGVKTFATTTRLEFPGRITAIVGPNGSGKSNIADAIRWVLGEQSFSLLRAKKTEDIIFSGSQQRSRAGMASTTITFNNEDGWLPIDYSHVAITRQAYRDGQNEYILNGQKVRLKDISELLAQTGLSERNYTIIGQGLVDVALALKPDERRKLFEEAAGIGLYRSRKEEAQRRLENTRKNLDRVLDILAEIKPRLRSLERQAQRFVEYQHLQSDLNLLLREWYGYQWHQKQEDLQNIRTTYQNQEARLHSLRKNHLEAEAKVEETRVELTAFRTELEENYRELSAHHRHLEQTTRELAIIDERQRSFQLQKDNLEIDITNLQEEISALSTQGRALTSEMDQHLAEFNTAVEEVKKIDLEMATISKEKDRVESELGLLKENRITLETKKIQQAVRIEEHDNRTKTFINEREKILYAITTIENENEQVETERMTSQNALDQIAKQHDELGFQIKQLNEQIEKHNQTRTSKQQQLNQLETARSKLSTQLSLLIEAESALSGYSEGSKKLVEISRQGRLPKGIEPFSQHILVADEYERAISSALGELTDLLVMPSQSQGILIDYLESNENERVALVSLGQDRQVNTKQDLTELDGVIGYAHTLITVDPAYRKLADNLFSGILLVNDASTAERIQNQHSGHLMVVTLSGVVFHPNGVIISGQSPSGRRIGRTRQQNELKKELSEIEQQIKTQSVKYEQMLDDYEILQTKLKDLTSTFAGVDQEKQQASSRFQAVQDTKARISEQLAWHVDRLEGLNKNLEEILTQVESGQMALRDLDRQIESALEQEREINTSLQDIPYFETQQAVNHWQTHQLVAQNAVDLARQRIKDNTDRLAVAQQRLEKFEARFTHLQADLVDIDGKKSVLSQEITEIHQKINTLQSERVDPLSEVSSKTENSITALQKLEANSHQQVIIAERQYTQLQLELSRKQDQLAHLRERIEDDFGLVSFESDQKYDGPTPLPFDNDLVEGLPHIQDIPDTHEEDIKRLKNQLRRMGAINPEAQQEYVDVKERFEFLTNQVADLEKASSDLQEVIATLDEMMETEFLKTFKAVNQEFSAFFSRLFNGGEAKLVFIDADNPVEGGVDIEARLPGRRQQGLALLSGGERSLTAVALIFALLKVSPPPFCILDEVDAMLDESNVGRFIEELRVLAQKIQVVIITHNRNTVQAADVIYGVTMGRDSTSQMISLKLEEVGDTYFEK